MLSGCGIRVFVLGNMGLWWGGWEKVQINYGGGWGCGRVGVWRGRGGGVYCLLEVPEGCDCQVNVLQAPLKVSRLLLANTLEGSPIHWAIVRGKKLYL